MGNTKHSKETLREKARAILSKLTPRERAALMARFGIDPVAWGALASGRPSGLPDDDDDGEDEIQLLVKKLVAAKAKKKPQ